VPEAPPKQAVDLDHDLEWDPPAAMTAAKRWTCRACGSTVLDYLGNVYGSAAEQACRVNRRRGTPEPKCAEPVCGHDEDSHAYSPPMRSSDDGLPSFGGCWATGDKLGVGSEDYPVPNCQCPGYLDPAVVEAEDEAPFGGYDPN
jgi:hypothetical protein